MEKRGREVRMSYGRRKRRCNGTCKNERSGFCIIRRHRVGGFSTSLSNVNLWLTATVERRRRSGVRGYGYNSWALEILL